METGQNFPGESSSANGLGFYSVLEIESLGFCGGYLILNPHARPLEFHCTLPILPERAQQILYGAALRPYLICEHIGPPLIARSRVRPAAVLVNDPAALRLAGSVDLPVVLVQPGEEGGCRLKASDNRQVALVQRICNAAAASMDWLEPFERIRDAIQEAHSVAR